jgi:hypothetical protein
MDMEWYIAADLHAQELNNIGEMGRGLNSPLF